MSKTQNPLLSRKMEEKWPKMINTEVLDMGGSCKPNEQINQISGRSRSSDEEGGGDGIQTLHASVWSKKKGRAPPLDPPLQMRP